MAAGADGAVAPPCACGSATGGVACWANAADARAALLRSTAKDNAFISGISVYVLDSERGREQKISLQRFYRLVHIALLR